MNKLDQITLKMIEHDAGSAKRIQHFLKVHRFAQLIGRAEQLDEHLQFILECAAIVHDIAIGPCKKKYGRCTGDLQEKEGPAYARELLAAFDLPEEDIQRICYLVAHHHSYHSIDGLDYQILVEADFLVNLYEEQISPEGIESTLERIFKTQTGIKLCKTQFAVNKSQETV
ncbi:HD domain-containing protein [Phocea massiliensis]|uniref:HD domain-containing protein n=1 Tax=Merdimmobilis hominis TaxID=2897707 RepID=A0A939BEF2_9FIRM|nr:HD domain-containing protein [Merdimmobilis hominis]MBM6920548.1 HD domain-containing protein [Merdimmobilis hominis]